MAAVWHLASKNRHKLAEFAALLAPWEVHLQLLPPDVPDCPEQAESFEANALDKAVFYSRYCGGWVLADDSGLCVDRLGGAPGVRSARFAGVHGDDEANNRKLLDALSGMSGDSRRAQFVCALALWNGSTRQGLVATGAVAGVIAERPVGSGGFGYDPLFLLPELGRTFAELRAEEKNRYSHRARAVEALMRLWRGQADAHLLGE